MVTQQTTIVLLEELVQSSIKNKTRSITSKTKYPGIRFNISISGKEQDALDLLETIEDRRDFIEKKMKVREKLTLNHEGEDFLADLNLFYNLLFVTGTEGISEETYQEVMKGTPAEKKDITEELLEA